MKPWIHAESSAKKYGGHPDDYLDIHQFMDSTKAAMADVRHRAILHSSFGCFIVEKVFGVTRKNSQGKVYSPRDVAEDHCMEDLGFIPSMEKWLSGLDIESWMGGPASRLETKKRADMEAFFAEANTDGVKPVSTDNSKPISDSPSYIETLRAQEPLVNPPKPTKKTARLWKNGYYETIVLES